MADESPRSDQPRIQTKDISPERNSQSIEYRVSSIRPSAPRADSRRMDRG